ncbi:MAG: phospho-N-acetylmuramoyl-pentapeptide-transferase [Planctomycetota bacterium]
MIYYLAQHNESLKILTGVTPRVILAAATAFVIMLLIMPPLIRWLKRMKFGESGAKGQGAEVVDAMREGKKGTPTMGGIGIVIAITIATLLWADLGEARPWVLLGALVGFASLGYLDDRTKIFKGSKGLSTWLKLTLQVALAVGCGLAIWAIGTHDADTLLKGASPAGMPEGFYKKDLGNAEYIVRLAIHQLAFPFVSVIHAIDLNFWIVPWAAFVATSCANGVNFTDGMDGLASGTVFIAAIAFVIIAYLVSRVDSADYLQLLYVSGGQEVAVVCAAMAGACLGFLWFNCAPAEVFMGDTGSQALGGTLGLAALMTKQEFLLLLVGAVFVVEAASVVIQVISFRCFGRRVFLCTPIHHHFQYLGWSESKIVLRFWIVAAICALVALATLKLR